MSSKKKRPYLGDAVKARLMRKWDRAEKDKMDFERELRLVRAQRYNKRAPKRFQPEPIIPTSTRVEADNGDDGRVEVWEDKEELCIEATKKYTTYKVKKNTVYINNPRLGALGKKKCYVCNTLRPSKVEKKSFVICANHRCDSRRGGVHFDCIGWSLSPRGSGSVTTVSLTAFVLNAIVSCEHLLPWSHAIGVIRLDMQSA